LAVNGNDFPVFLQFFLNPGEPDDALTEQMAIRHLFPE
jgi:hypothetical protein